MTSWISRSKEAHQLVLGHFCVTAITMVKMFTQLPEELLVQIISLLSQKSLLDVAKCTRQLRRLANTELYSALYYERQVPVAGQLRSFARKALVQDEREAVCAKKELNLKRRQTRIHNIVPFFHSVVHYSELKALIEIAAFEMIPFTHATANPETASSDTSSWNEVTFLESLFNIRSLHLSFDRYEIMDYILSLPLKSLSLHHSQEVYDIDYLHSLFSVPTLRWLCISGLQWSKPLLRKDDIDRTQTSDVTKLSFPSSAPSANDFAELLTWPKALKSFGFEASPDERETQPRLRSFISLLSAQKESLEELFLSGEPRHPFIAYHLTHKLAGFPALTRLSVRAEWLWFSQPPATVHAMVASMWDVLPIHLEQLQVEIPVILHYSDVRWDGSMNEPYLIGRLQQLVPPLRELAQKKVGRQLSLEEVIIWFRKRDDLRMVGRVVDYQERMYMRLFPQPGTDERGTLDAGFEQVGCKLRSVCSVEPPLIGI